jgi:hypothetical protein
MRSSGQLRSPRDADSGRPSARPLRALVNAGFVTGHPHRLLRQGAASQGSRHHHTEGSDQPRTLHDTFEVDFIIALMAKMT